MKTKRNPKNCKFKFFLFLLLSTFFVPPNIRGEPFKANKNLDVDLELRILNSDLTGYQDTVANSQETDVESDHVISWKIIFFMTIISVVAPYLNFLWISFLKDQPLDKQCVMNRLCRDVIRVNLLYCLLWTTASMILRMLDGSGSEIRIKGVAYCTVLLNEAVIYILMMYLLLVGSLRLYTLRYNVLDPVEEYFGKCENMVVTCIRFFLFSIVTFMVSMLHVGSVKPFLFYKITNQQLTWDNTPLGTQVLYGVDVGFNTICGMVFLGAKIYQNSKYHTLQIDQFRIGVQRKTNSDGNQQCSQAEADQTTDEESNPVSGKLFKDRTSLPALLYIGTGMLVAIIVLLEYFDVFDSSIWWIITAMVGMLGVVIPIVLFSLYNDLKVYCWRKMRSEVNEVSRAIHDGLSKFNMLKPRVSPLQ